MTLMLSAALLALTGLRDPAISPADMATAVNQFTQTVLSVDDIRRVECRRIDSEPTEARCEWLQRRHGRWQRYSSHLAMDGRGWRLIDEPNPIGRTATTRSVHWR